MDNKTDTKYIESISKWKESLLLERDSLINDIHHRKASLKLEQKILKLNHESLSICEDRIKEADTILKDKA